MNKRTAWLCGLALSVGTTAGCVERRMTVVSDPPGAMMSLNGQEIGPTPVDVPSDKFIYHGDYDIKLVKDGYEPLLIKQPVPPKCYEYPGIDFFSEHLWPGHIKDRRVFEYQMLPVRIVPNEEVMQNAEAVRRQGQSIGPPLPPDRRQPREILPEPRPNARLGYPVVD